MKERSILRTIVVNFVNSLKPKSLWGSLVGKDYNGTEYYEIPQASSNPRLRPRRWFAPSTRDDFQQDIPPEWEAWLRYRRTDPPTEEEVMMNLNKTKEVKQKAFELDKARQLPAATDKEVQRTDGDFPVYEDLESTPGAFSNRRQ